MINPISNSHVAQNISMVNKNNNVSSKATEETNESTNEKIKEASSPTTSNHIINVYA
jgi:hypothetical protein